MALLYSRPGAHRPVRIAFADEVDEFGPNDVGFIQQGFGHYIEQVGNEPTEIIILWNNPVFEAISLNSWLGGNPVSLLEANLLAPTSLIDRLPKRDMGIIAKKA